MLRYKGKLVSEQVVRGRGVRGWERSWGSTEGIAGLIHNLRDERSGTDDKWLLDFDRTNPHHPHGNLCLKRGLEVQIGSYMYTAYIC